MKRLNKINTIVLYFSLILTLSCYSLSAQSPVNQMDVNGERHGTWRKDFDKTNQPRYEGQFAHGKEIGLFKFYKLVDGKSVLSATKEFNADDDIATVKFFSSTGKLISEGKMNGKLFIGKWTYYHNKIPTVMSIENYNDKGQLHGEKIVFYEFGQIAETSNFVNGKQEGKAIWYSEKGVVIKEFMYENDELHGMSKYYDNKGQPIAEGAYKRGQKHGVWKYYADGKLTEEKDFTITSKNPIKQ